MGDDMQLCLHWNDFHSALASSFADLRDGDIFVDVTLACEGKQLHAHRLLLSACSPFFRDLLQQHPCPHPIVILPGLRFQDLANILEFVYNGEVRVYQHELSAFLKAAAHLRIKGLARDEQQVAKSGKSAEETFPVPYPVGEQTSSLPDGVDDIQSRELDTRVKMETDDPSGLVECTLSSDFEAERDTTMELISQMKTEVLQNTNAEQPMAAITVTNTNSSPKTGHVRKRPPVVCPICNKALSRMDHLRSHLRYIHSGLTPRVLCSLCNRVFKNAESLRSHIGLYHKGRRRKNTASSTAMASSEGTDTSAQVIAQMSSDPTEMPCKEAISEQTSDIVP